MSANCELSRTENTTTKTARAARWHGRCRAMSMVLLSVLVLISGTSGAQAASGPQPTTPPGAGISASQTTHAPPGKVSKLEEFGVRGSVTSAVLYQHFDLTLDTGGAKKYTFNGDAGGLTVPGVSGLFGTVSTDNLDRLVNETVSFAYHSLPGMLIIHFFNDHPQIVGTLVAGNVGTVTGIGGGSGHWSSA